MHVSMLLYHGISSSEMILGAVYIVHFMVLKRGYSLHGGLVKELLNGPGKG